MKYQVLNLLNVSDSNHRDNHEILGEILKKLKLGIVIKAKLKNNLQVDFQESKDWRKNYQAESHWNSSDNPPPYSSVYVIPEFHQQELCPLPIQLEAGSEGRLYGVAFLNGDLEQDQYRNGYLIGFPTKERLAPLVLIDISEAEENSIENVVLYD
jgi:hypothetical protein